VKANYSSGIILTSSFFSDVEGILSLAVSPDSSKILIGGRANNGNTNGLVYKLDSATFAVTTSFRFDELEPTGVGSFIYINDTFSIGVSTP
jgi:DNA-binding beta-propeller fold protein YncE